MIKCIKTTYKVQGEKQPCFKVYNNGDKESHIMFVPLYRLFGTTSTMMIITVFGKVDSKEELNVRWADMNKERVMQIIHEEAIRF